MRAGEEGQRSSAPTLLVGGGWGEKESNFLNIDFVRERFSFEYRK